MPELGYALSCEEHPARDLVRYAQRAEQVGFSFAMISDHFHPWLDRQGESPFAWTVLGAIAQATTTLRVGTGVTCPTFRYHPAIVAQAAATVATMMPGRFLLGLGSGENLNEHIVGQGWPPADVRLEMLEEAVEMIRELWQGGVKSYYGRHLLVENARLYSLPEELPAIYLAAGGRQLAELAGRVADGLITTSPDQEVIEAFQSSAGARKPMIGQMAVCVAQDERQARKTAFEWWRTAALKGELSQELPLPRHFEQASELATEDAVAEEIVMGADAGRHLAKLGEFFDGGFQSVYVHQVGPDQEAFFRFYEQEILPEFRREPARAAR